MQNEIDELEFARQQILEPNICRNLPVFYKYAECKYLKESKYVVPYNISEKYNTDKFCVIEIYKPIINNVLTFNTNERDSI
jgi:hypothetical protein